MSEIKADLQYTKDHEWVQKTATPKVVRIGITDFAQSSLGDVTFLQLPQVGRTVQAGEVVGTVESVKAVSDIYAPTSGKVIKINDALVADPAPINTDPYQAAWMMEIELSNESELSKLLNSEAYKNIAH